MKLGIDLNLKWSTATAKLGDLASLLELARI